MAERYFGTARCLVVGPGIKTGMPIRIDNPHEVGADRLVNAVAAYERFGGACVVVDFGTGDQLRRGLGDGGVPGRRDRPRRRDLAQALAERAAKLPKIDLGEPDAAIGKSSRAAIQSGVVYGFAGLVDSLARRIEDELGEATLIATGGIAHRIAPFCETVDEIDDLLTLKGLRIIYERELSVPINRRPSSSRRGGERARGGPARTN